MAPNWLIRLNEDGRTISREEFETLVSDNRRLGIENDNLNADLDALERKHAQLNEWYEYIVKSAEADIPSITEQTKWPVGFFDFGRAKTPDIRFFNCSIIRHNGELILFARRSHNIKNLTVGMNDIVALKMNDQLVPMGGAKVGFPTTLHEQHHEDPRVCRMFGHLFVSATTFNVAKDRRSWSGAHQVIGRLNDNFQVDYPADPIYGFNGGSPLMNTGNEKNWLWFEHDGLPHMVYMTDPEHIVVQFKPNLIEPEIEYKTPFGHNIWKHGHIRGGTPPVLVDGEYWTFFHSSTPWLGSKRRYHMGALAFESKPPFKITRYTPLPLLSGSKNDEWHDFLPLVVFPCGAILEKGEWIITMGVNDCTSAWIKIPHEDILSLTRKTNEVQPVSTPSSQVEPEDKPATPDSGQLGVEGVTASSGSNRRVAQPRHNAKRARNAQKRKPGTSGGVAVDQSSSGERGEATGA